METEPWRGYRKEPARPGWRHPLRREQIRRSLLDRGLRVERVVLTMPAPEARPLLLIRARRIGDLSLEGKRLSQDERRSMPDPVSLRIAALPHEHLVAGRDALAAGALDLALRWIVDARARGNAWQATERRWSAHLVDGVAVVTEEQRQARGAYLGFTGLEDR